MTQGAATRRGGKGSRCTVGSIGDIFPLSVAKFLVVHTEAFFLPHHEDRRERVRDKTPAAVENRLTASVLLHCVRLKENDGPVREIPGRSGIYRSGNAVAPHNPDLPVLEIVERVKFRERVPVSGREAYAVRGRSGQSLRVPYEHERPGYEQHCR